MLGYAPDGPLFYCTVCDTNAVMNPFPVHFLKEMQKYGFIHNIFYSESLNLEHYGCTNCGANDRDRLLALYLKNYLSNTEVHLLDLAPSAPLASFIKRQKGVHYRSMDLYMEHVDDQFDICDMNGYKNEQFDFFICSHILEHIPDDIQAMKELYRVLKKGGTGIAMVPINLQVEKTLEDPSCTDIPTRWKLYGQDDHIRMYAKQDFISRLESVGFKVELLGVNEFSEKAFTHSAIYPNSVLYLVHK